MNKLLFFLFFIFVAGLSILLLPDEGQPVFRFNANHGPSLPDLVGLVMMLGSWLTINVIAAFRWGSLPASKRVLVIRLAGLYLLSVSGIALSLSFSIEWLLWICVAFASIVNIHFIGTSFRI